MAKRGLITAGRAPTGGLGFGLMPFVVGIYEMQAGRIDAELARLFEDYYQQTYRQSLAAAAAGAPRDPGQPERAATTWKSIPSRARRTSSNGPRPGA